MLTEEVQEYFYQRIGELIKDARMEANVTQDQLAHFLDLSRASIVKIEHGKQKVQIHTLIEIINYLEIPKNDFFEKLTRTFKIHVSKKIESKIKKEISTDNTVEINKLREFINFSINKNNQT